MIVNPGIRRFLGSAIQRLFNSASFYATLTHSVVPERGTGSPTFTRASTATVMGYGPTDNAVDGLKLLTVAANEARFVGARRISEGVWSNTFADGSLIPAATNTGYLAEGARTNLVWPSEDLTHVRYVSGGGGIAVVADQVVAPDGTTTADQLTASGANGTLIQDLGVIASAAQAFSLYLKRKTGTGNVDITLDGGATWTTQAITTTEWTRCQITKTLANPDVGIRLVTSGDAVYAWGLQCE